MGFEFFIRCSPPTKTHQAKRLGVVQGRARLFKSKEQLEIQESLASLLLPYQPETPLSGPIKLSVTITYPPLKRHLATKAGREYLDSGHRFLHTGKPDLDNFSKGFVDELVRLRFIEDDKHVYDLNLRKYYGKDAGIHVEIVPASLRDLFLLNGSDR